MSYVMLPFNTEPSSPNWRLNADINHDGVCNIHDVTVAIINFNKNE